MIVALISDVFFDRDPEQRLRERLAEAATARADLAVLPELPLNAWSPATTTPRDDDAEPPGGPRQEVQAAAARDAGIALLGGAIVQDPASGVRHNTALLFASDGTLLGDYRKLHLPEEPGFWETRHYDPGDEAPRVLEGLGAAVGVQICSDINRPEGCHLLGALGAVVILAPRATELATWPRWRPIVRANALTSCCWIVSVNRPAPEQGVLLGGPSIAVAPTGEVVLETTDTLATVTIDTALVEQSRQAYPGYLPVRADLYAGAWREIAEEK